MLFLWGLFSRSCQPVLLLHCLLAFVPSAGPAFFLPFVSFPFLSSLLIYACYRNKDAQATVKSHIKLLHDYNEIRDVGQGLMGIIADNRGVRVRDVYQDFDVDEGD